MKSNRKIYSKKNKIQKNIKKKYSKKRKNYVRKTKSRKNISLKRRNNKKKTRKDKRKIKNKFIGGANSTQSPVETQLNTFRDYLRGCFGTGRSTEGNIHTLFGYKKTDDTLYTDFEWDKDTILSHFYDTETEDKNPFPARLTNYLNSLVPIAAPIPMLRQQERQEKLQRGLNKIIEWMKNISFSWEDWKIYCKKKKEEGETKIPYHIFRNKIVNIILLMLYVLKIKELHNNPNFTISFQHNEKKFTYTFDRNKSTTVPHPTYIIRGLGSESETSDYDISLLLPTFKGKGITDDNKKNFKNIIIKVYTSFNLIFQKMNTGIPQLTSMERFDTNLYIHPIHINSPTDGKVTEDTIGITTKYFLKSGINLYIPNPVIQTEDKKPQTGHKKPQTRPSVAEDDLTSGCPLFLNSIYERELNNANLHLLIMFYRINSNGKKKQLFTFNNSFPHKDELQKHFIKLCLSRCPPLTEPLNDEKKMCKIDINTVLINYQSINENEEFGSFPLTNELEQLFKSSDEDIHYTFKKYFSNLHKLLHYADETYYSVSAFIHVVELLQAKNKMLFNELKTRIDDFKNILKISIIDQLAFILDAYSKYKGIELKKKISKYFARLNNALQLFKEISIRQISQQNLQLYMKFEIFSQYGDYQEIMAFKDFPEKKEIKSTPDSELIILYEMFEQIGNGEESSTNFIKLLYNQLIKDNYHLDINDFCIKLS